MKKELCEAFCKGTSVYPMRNGFAVRTPFDDANGEPISAFVIGPNEEDLFSVVDGGTTIPLLEAAGVSLESDTRLMAFTEILKSYGASYSDTERQIYKAGLERSSLPQEALNFMALLIRVQDLSVLSREKVENSFRDDVMERLRERFQEKTSFREQEPVSEQLSSVTPDVVIQAEAKEPVAIFIATNGQKISEAVFLHMMAMYEYGVPIRVVAILQDDNPSISFKMRQRADNYLDAVPRYAGEAKATLDRVEREVFGRAASRAFTEGGRPGVRP